jgi:hypothetical protein
VYHQLPWKSPFTPDSFTMCLHVCTIFIGGSPLAAAACAFEEEDGIAGGVKIRWQNKRIDGGEED